MKIYEKSKQPSEAQVEADREAMAAFLAKHPVTRLEPACADNCIQVLPPSTRQSHKQKGARS